MALDMTNDDLTAVITWALERIAHGEFKEARDAAGNLDSLVIDKDFGPVGRVTEPAGHITGAGLVASENGGLPQAKSARKYVEEVRRLFPQMVKRGASLRSVPESKQLPDYVRRYVVEASRCYVYGRFLAALFLCRSAMGEAVLDALRKQSHDPGISGIASEGLKGILRVALEKGLVDQKLHHDAEEIRTLANQAIHGIKRPTDDDSKHAYEVTCEVLRRLYRS